MEFLISRIARMVNGRIIGDENRVIRGSAGFETAAADQITYAGNAKYLKQLEETHAGAILVPEGVEQAKTTLILVKNPRIAFNRVAELFLPRSRPKPGISVKADIGTNFVHGEDVSIGPFVSVGDGVKVGDRVTLHPHVVIGDNTVIGDDVEIFPNVTILERCEIGNRVIIHPGTVIGSDGFGFEPEGENYIKIHHTGIVRIDDDVEIGACNTVDRATNGRTWIKSGVKTDNLIQIGHNVVVGENTLIVSQVGISGSVTIGRHVILAGQAGISGHIEIGDNAVVGPQAGIVKSITPGEVLSGTPAMPHKQWLRTHRVLPMLPDLKKRIEKLEKKLDEIQSLKDMDFEA
jgi:UDP-3-O-[3-hydroxymyristoyl] glucosamine N-acyltransferase